MADIRADLDRIGKCKFQDALGLKTVLADPGHGIVECQPGALHRNPEGGVHGGLIFTMIDQAAGTAAFHLENGFRKVVTQNASVYFLRAPKGGKLTAEATMVKGGSHLAIVNVDVMEEGERHIARAEVSMYYMGEFMEEFPYSEDKWPDEE